ncbi:MAG: 1-deoxy-D-xylulose-5-phosphate reductoisomerase [Alphaproteobacteria bacterium]|nr:1-deoxy-D-xylulose-5-phosphate reductoisomerase [Alphaproteobacteria bacterium]
MQPVDYSTKTPNEKTASLPRSVTVLGSTGSVGTQTLELIEANPDQFNVVALTANQNVDLLIKQALALRPQMVVIGDESKYAALKDALAGKGIEVAAGAKAITDAAQRQSDWVMAAIVGAAGLPPTLAAVKRGATVAFANKECLVCAGPLMMREVQDSGAQLLPVDSEHNAIYQVFDDEGRDGIERLILTASGGPFRHTNLEDMARVTPQEAVKHPVWSMGSKISIDSATMMNKGLEIIEASFLFDMPEDKIGVIVHPQSVIHSMVEYKDGSVLAQLGSPDMRTPIAYALAYPKRMVTPAARLNLAQIGSLTFEDPDPVRFRSLVLTREALKRGGTAPTILNAANEIAVDAFLKGRIGFLDIAKIVEETLQAMTITPLNDLEAVTTSDTDARRIATDKANACTK